MRWGHKSRRGAASGESWREARDEVTGLVPYAAFVHLVAESLTGHAGTRSAGRPAVLLVDLEGVAEATAAEEHPAGDELLRLVATRVAREVGSLGVLARMSDHQLGVLFADLSAPAVALDLAYRISASVSAPLVLASQRRVQLSVSCGLVTRDALDPRATASDLLRGAGLAVREARRQGRNRIEVCTPELVAVADETLAIGKDLRQALQEKGLRVCYQPLVDLTHGSVLGFEALVRWSHPVHGHVSPSRFVPVAEEFGLISELGTMVLSTATAQVQQWSSTFRIPLDAHVNFSGVDLAQDGFVDTVEACLEASGLPATQLVVEITEATVEPDLETARSRFDALHDLGVRVALDDFGTGRSALSYLQSLAVDILKVDRSYIDSVDQPAAVSAVVPSDLPSGTGTRGDDLLRGVVAFGQALGIEVYGEGIEDEEQRLRLRRAGCDIGQGYLFARPLPAEDAAALLRGQAAVADTLGARLIAAEGTPRSA